MQDEESICVALLHDTIEDTDLTIEDLKQQGFPQSVLDALCLLTHDKKVPYMDYIKAIKANTLARQVKIADLLHNSDPSRLRNAQDPKAVLRNKRYQQALQILTNKQNKEESS